VRFRAATLEVERFAAFRGGELAFARALGALYAD
jgi:hypothetical protein